MAQYDIDITTSPVNLKAAPTSLVEGRVYRIQVTGSEPVRFSDSAAAPSNRLNGHYLASGHWWVRAIGSDPVWAWTARGDLSALSISDVPD